MPPVPPKPHMRPILGLTILLVTCLPLAALDVSITESQVVIHMTPGGRITITQYALTGRGVATGNSSVSDVDGDGIFAFPRPSHPSMTILVGEVDTGSIAAVSTGGPVTVSPLPQRSILRGPAGDFTSLMVRDGGFLQLVWIRPGVGCWKGSSSSGVRTGGWFIAQTNEFAPMSGTPTPGAFEHGDRVLLLNDLEPIAGIVDDDLDAPASGGAVSFVVPSTTSFSETSPAVLPLLRTGGSDGTVSVRFAPAGGDAVSGVDYDAFDNRVTFGPGELLKNVVVPLIDSPAYAGFRMVMVALTDPIGATLGTPSTRDVGIISNEARPFLELGTVPHVVSEGNVPWTLQVPLTLTGATRIPAQVHYGWHSSKRNVTVTGDLTFAPGETVKNVEIPIAADTSSDGNDTLVVSIGNATDATIRGSQSVEIVVREDDDPALVPQDVTVDESANRVTIPVAIVPDAVTGDIHLTWATADGTAKAGSDYLPKSETVIYTGQGLAVQLISDDVVEESETFYVDLIAATHGAIARQRVAITLTDDSLPLARLESITITEGGPGQLTEARVRAHLSWPAKTAASFTPALSISSATADRDYINDLASTVVRFAPGESEAEFVVRIIGDDEVEGAERIWLSGQHVVGLRWGQDGFITIADDDDPDSPWPTITASDASVAENGREVVIPLTLSNPTKAEVIVDFRTANGTATAPSDFTGTIASVVFAPGQLTQTIRIPIVDDAEDEDNEVFNVLLASGSGTLVRDRIAVTIADDDEPSRRRSVRH